MRSSEVLSDTRGRAWLVLVGCLALHVLDEALTGFLEIYNPIVTEIRARWWFPVPRFTFGIWLGGLIVAIVVLLLLTPLVRRDRWWVRLMATVFGTVMVLNGIAHLAGSIYFARWVPGATTAPLILVAGAWLLKSSWFVVRSQDSTTNPHPRTQ